MIDKIATLQELETNWSLDDVMRAHAIIDYRSELEFQNRKTKKCQS